MKTLIAVLTALVASACITGCSDDPPSVRVANERATKANVQFQQANGNTINHNEVVGGTFSNLQDVVEGAIHVKAVIQSETVSPTTAFNASENNNYTVVIQAGDPPTLRVDTQDK